jgi:hypothetical protein
MSEDNMGEEDVLSQLTPEEYSELQKYANYSAPAPQSVHNVHKFLAEVAESEDTTKTGYLTDDELGKPTHPVRTNKELALFCQKIADMPLMAELLNAESEITTSTSLSRDAKLLSLAVTTTRQVADVTKKSGKPNKGWFKKRNKGGGTEE